MQHGTSRAEGIPEETTRRTKSTSSELDSDGLYDTPPPTKGNHDQPPPTSRSVDKAREMQQQVGVDVISVKSEKPKKASRKWGYCIAISLILALVIGCALLAWQCFELNHDKEKQKQDFETQTNEFETQKQEVEAQKNRELKQLEHEKEEQKKEFEAQKNRELKQLEDEKEEQRKKFEAQKQDIQAQKQKNETQKHKELKQFQDEKEEQKNGFEAQKQKIEAQKMELKQLEERIKADAEDRGNRKTGYAETQNYDPLFSKMLLSAVKG